jgi:hypothetical protein
MKRLQNHLIGIDQGTSILFSDFEDGGEMWTGKGARSRATRVSFSSPFRFAPAVHVTLDMFDMDSNANHRVDISAANIDCDGFDIVFKTWGDSKIARVRAAWMAIGELAGDDEWELY